MGSIFKKNNYIELKMKKNTDENAPNIPNGMWRKCNKCGNIIYNNDLAENKYVCTKCDHHFRISARDRIKIIADENTFVEFDEKMESLNPIGYKTYEDKINTAKESSNLKEAVVCGKCKINDNETIIAVMDSSFMMGSMGSVVGEKITRAIEYATKNKKPIIIFTASGGARMQEGIFSLMQMAKVSAAISRHSEEGRLYVAVLTDPTTGGVTASFAMQGDLILSEPNTLIGFAGKRVIEQTIKQELPKGFQTSEFLLKRGFVDKIVHRKNMKLILGKILENHNM